MSVDERSPKRQRRSYSPPSPPPPAAAKPAFVAHHPHTPPPSVHMSPTWNAQSSSLQQGGVTFPTPPSTSGYQGHMTGRGPSSERGVESEKGTPAESGDVVRKDGDGDVSMGGERDAEHRRSDHERSSDATPAVALPGLFKLPTKPIARKRPHPTEDLLELYDLRAIQASVRRKDPITGEKINKLRKSYEGKLKDLGLEGKNKATESMRELEGLVDPAWDTILPNGNTLWQEQNPTADTEGPLKDEMLSCLDAALSFKPGRLPKGEYERWNHQLDLDHVNVKATGPAKIPAPTRTATSNFLKSNTGPRNSAPASPKMAAGRPDRTNKKRSYDDRSYEGYEDDGYSTGDIERKRRKRAEQA